MNKFRQLRCSFCRKTENEVLKLVAGPNSYICDECVAIASRIINDSSDNPPPVIRQPVWNNLLTRLRKYWGSQAQRVSSHNAS